MWYMSRAWLRWSCQSPVAQSFRLLNDLNSSCGGMFKLKDKIWCRFVALLGHFECDSHTVHMLTQQHLLPPLTSTVKSSLFTHAHPRPVFLAARLHQCVQTILIIITTAVLSLDRPRISLNLWLSRENSSSSKSRSAFYSYYWICIVLPVLSSPNIYWVNINTVSFS